MQHKNILIEFIDIKIMYLKQSFYWMGLKTNYIKLKIMSKLET